MNDNTCGQRTEKERLEWLATAQKYPLELKEVLSLQRIRQAMRHFDGKMYVAYSGGLDSTVLLHLIRREYPDVVAVFADTGQEFESIYSQVRATDNVTWLEPRMSFDEIVKKYGIPMISKKLCRMIQDVKNPTARNAKTVNLRLTGMTQKGEYQPRWKIPNKWMKLLDAPFRVTNKCCGILKIDPTKPYQKRTGEVPFVGVMAEESENRRSSYARGGGCNAFNQSRGASSRPIMFWTEQDILQYVIKYQIPYADIYGEIVLKDGLLAKTGEQRTGCKYCLFGAHMKKGENQFQALARIEPESYKKAIEEYGYAEALDYCGIPWRPVNLGVMGCVECADTETKILISPHKCGCNQMESK